MPDVVFYLKSLPDKATRALPWPAGTRHIPVEAPRGVCTGADFRCSLAYGALWSQNKDAQGRVLPNFLRRYARGIRVGRVAFVGFSAAHGFLNALAANPSDRARISAYVLLDATFGGGKSGYEAFIADAARGQRLFVTTTANTGGDKAFAPVWARAAEQIGKLPRRVDARAPMQTPSGGAWQLGDLAYLLRFVDAQGGSELPHWRQHEKMAPLLGAYLVPYWQGRLGGWPWWAWGLLGAGLLGGAGVAATELLTRRR